MGNSEPLAFQEHQPPSSLAVLYWTRHSSDYVLLIRAPDGVHIGIRGREVGHCVQVLLQLSNIPGWNSKTESDAPLAKNVGERTYSSRCRPLLGWQCNLHLNRIERIPSRYLWCGRSRKRRWVGQNSRNRTTNASHRHSRLDREVNHRRCETRITVQTSYDL